MGVKKEGGQQFAPEDDEEVGLAVGFEHVQLKRLVARLRKLPDNHLAPWLTWRAMALEQLSKVALLVERGAAGTARAQRASLKPRKPATQALTPAAIAEFQQRHEQTTGKKKGSRKAAARYFGVSEDTIDRVLKKKIAA